MDYLIKSITHNGHFRAYFTDMSALVKKTANIHHSSPDAATVLGRALIATALTGTSLLKGSDQIHVVINGRGPIGQIVTESSAQAQLRGYVTNPKATVAKKADGQPNVPLLVGLKGSLRLTKVQPGLEPYSGEVALVTGEIGDDFTYYLAQSEQIPSAIGVSVFTNSQGIVEHAGGFLLQTMPGASDNELDLLEQHLSRLPSISSMLAEGLQVEQIFPQLFGKEKIDFLDKIPVTLAAPLPKDWYAKALKTLPTKELTAMITEDHGAEIVDRFNGRKYQFSEAELQRILDSKQA